MDSLNIIFFLTLKKFNKKKKRRMKNASLFLGGKFSVLNQMKSIRFVFE